MHQIPPMAEQLLRAQGVTDAELDELRRTGTLRRADGSGNSIDIQVADGTSATMQASSISVDGISLNGAAIPPEAIEKLKRYHRFMPDHVIQNLELATGQDIDGDGQVGGGGTNPAPPSVAGTTGRAETTTSPSSGAMPSSASGAGPFVGGSPDAKSPLLPIVLTLLVLAALGYVAYRAFA